MNKYLLILCLLSPYSYSQFIVAMDENLLKTIDSTIIDEITELYRRAEMDVTFEFVSGERAVRNANNGVYQALDVRFLNNESLNNMIPVQESIYTKHEINVYSVNPLPTINSYEELAPYIVAFPRGIQLRKRIEELVPDLNVFIAPNYSLVIDALDKNKADVILASGLIKAVFFSKEDSKRLIKLNDIPLEVIYAYHFIHKSQSHIEPKLARIIREMKLEGFFGGI
ncbi:MAG: hypothetical protein HRU38_06495 [Saccharospirillaceae bacterium]|nr:hypothetical protein [Saccharospirillaceae bacterium]